MKLLVCQNKKSARLFLEDQRLIKEVSWSALKKKIHSCLNSKAALLTFFPDTPKEEDISFLYFLLFYFSNSKIFIASKFSQIYQDETILDSGDWVWTGLSEVSMKELKKRNSHLLQQCRKKFSADKLEQMKKFYIDLSMSHAMKSLFLEFEKKLTQNQRLQFEFDLLRVSLYRDEKERVTKYKNFLWKKGISKSLKNKILFEIARLHVKSGEISEAEKIFVKLWKPPISKSQAHIFLYSFFYLSKISFLKGKINFFQKNYKNMEKWMLGHVELHDAWVYTSLKSNFYRMKNDLKQAGEELKKMETLQSESSSVFLQFLTKLYFFSHANKIKNQKMKKESLYEMERFGPRIENRAAQEVMSALLKKKKGQFQFQLFWMPTDL